MSRLLCIALVLGSLPALTGCSGGLGGCRRPSFMEFRSPCGRQSDPCGAPAPACTPACGPSCGPAAPCCDEGHAVSGPGSMPVMTEQGTFS
jgi:hypothetical protein